MKRDIIQKAQRIVIKIGSSIITDTRNVIDEKFMNGLARQVGDLVKVKGKEVVIVSSGAVAAGMMVMKLTEKPKNMSEKQAVAACGQGYLIHKYSELFEKNKMKVAQILLTSEDMADRKRYLNAKNTIENLLMWKIVPVINENDTIVTTEIKLGDNDNLSAEVACLLEADLLIILSDVDGFCDGDPAVFPGATVISHVDHVGKYLRKVSSKAGSAVGTGGIYTKLQAARKTMIMGIPAILAKGKEKNIVSRLVDGDELGTLFYRSGKKMSKKNYFIAFNVKPKGKIWIDGGATDALLRRGRSLLPSGITRVAGIFKIGDVVEILDESGAALARGLVNYGSMEIERIRGAKTSEIEKKLGYRLDDEVVHRNNMVVMMKN